MSCKEHLTVWCSSRRARRSGGGDAADGGDEDHGDVVRGDVAHADDDHRLRRWRLVAQPWHLCAYRHHREDVDCEAVDREDGYREDVDREDVDREDVDREDVDREDVDHEDGDHEDVDREDGDHEDVDREDGDHEDVDREDVDREDGDHDRGVHVRDGRGDGRVRDGRRSLLPSAPPLRRSGHGLLRGGAPLWPAKLVLSKVEN